jgi:hypothetical protein
MVDSKRQAVASRDELVKAIAALLHDWEQSSELYTEAAERIVDFVLAPDKGVREPRHEDDEIAGESE